MLSSICNVVASNCVVVPLTSKSEFIMTFPVPFGVRLISALVTSEIIAVPLNAKLDSDVPPNSVYTSEKLSFILSNAVLSGSPVPSLAADPMLIVCCAIYIVSSGVFIYK